MASNREMHTLLKSFRDYVDYNSRFLNEYIANQNINFPPDVRGGEGGQAKAAKLPMNWEEKNDPLSGGDLGTRKEYGSRGWNRKSMPGKTNEQYLHKHEEETEAYTDGQDKHPYDDGSVKTDMGGYDIEKMPPLDEED